MPERIALVMITRELRRNKASLKRLVNVLSAAPQFEPTGWSQHDGAPLTAFEPATFIKELGATKSDESVALIARSKVVKYQGFFGMRNAGYSYIDLTFSGEADGAAIKDIFELGDRLAAQFRADFGVVHPIWTTKLTDPYPSYSGSARFRIDQYDECGPKAVCARTWFGAHVVGLIGRAPLVKLGALETEWGGMRLDLVGSPWASDRATLATRQAEVMTELKTSGVFGDYSSPLSCTKGARWNRSRRGGNNAMSR